MARQYGPAAGDSEPLVLGPDLGGIPVDDVEDRLAGVVVGSLSESGSGLVRYLDIDLERLPRHVLVPVGHARLKTELGRPRLKLRAATREDLAGIPPYRPEEGVPGEPFEHEVLAAHSRLFHDQHYYAHPAYDHRRLYAGEHPIVRDGAASTPEHSLEFLSNLRHYRVAEGEPDIRGWDFVLGDGRTAGMIADLVVDPRAEKVRYALVHDSDAECDWFLPVGYLELDTAAPQVIAPGLERDDLARLPAAPARTLTRAEECAVLEVLHERLSGPRRFARPDFRADAGLD